MKSKLLLAVLFCIGIPVNIYAGSSVVSRQLTIQDMHALGAIGCSAFARLLVESYRKDFSDSDYLFHNWAITESNGDLELDGDCAMEFTSAKTAEGGYESKTRPAGVDGRGVAINIKIPGGKLENWKGKIGGKDFSITLMPGADYSDGVNGSVLPISEIKIGGSSVWNTERSITSQVLKLDKVLLPADETFDNLLIGIVVDGATGAKYGFAGKGYEDTILVNTVSAEAVLQGMGAVPNGAGDQVFIKSPDYPQRMGGCTSLIKESGSAGPLVSGGTFDPPRPVTSDVCWDMLKKYFRR